jgi:hypothetical protein
MTREDPLKQTPACELDRDNRVMTREEEEEEEEGERAVGESQRAELRGLRAEVVRLHECCVTYETGIRRAWEEHDQLRAEVERLTAELAIERVIAAEAIERLTAERNEVARLMAELNKYETAALMGALERKPEDR